MGVKRTGPTQTQRECRELLRHVAHPRRLRENLLAKRIWSGFGLELNQNGEANLTNCLAASVRTALDGVSLRQRVIIERCDLAGEANAHVAADLHISLRHLYRERRAAITQICSRLGEKGREGQVATRVMPDALTLQLSLAARLEQNGQWTAAAEMLESLSSELDDVSKRCMVESRLVDLYATADRYSLADEHMRRASQLCSRGVGPPWLGSEIAVSAGRLAIATGDFSTAQDVAWRSCLQLRSWSSSSHDPRVASALLNALNLASLIAISCGDARGTAALTSEALVVAGQLQSPESGALMDARMYAIEAQILAGNAKSAESELWACYRLAIDLGQTRDALSVAIFVAGYLRLTGRASHSVELLKPLVHAARRVGTGDVLGGFLIELGSAATDLQDTDLARTCLDELQSFTLVSPWISAHASLLRARTEFADRHFGLSLAASEAAESSFIRIGRERLVPTALQLQAESLAALGDTGRAVRTMRVAIERFEMTRQHYPRRLIAAYLTMGSLTGDSAFNVKARRLRAELKN